MTGQRDPEEPTTSETPPERAKGWGDWLPGAAPTNLSDSWGDWAQKARPTVPTKSEQFRSRVPQIVVIAVLALGAIAWLGHLGPFAPPEDRGTALDAALTLDASEHGHNDEIVCARLLDLNQPSGNKYRCIVVETSADGSELPPQVETVDYAPDGTWTVQDVRPLQ